MLNGEISNRIQLQTTNPGKTFGFVSKKVENIMYEDIEFLWQRVTTRGRPKRVSHIKQGQSVYFFFDHFRIKFILTYE